VAEAAKDYAGTRITVGQAAESGSNPKAIGFAPIDTNETIDHQCTEARCADELPWWPVLVRISQNPSD